MVNHLLGFPVLVLMIWKSYQFQAGQDHTGNKCVFIKDLKMNSGYSVYC